MTRRFRPPIYATSHRGVTQWMLNIGDDEQQVILRLLGELRSILSDDDDDGDGDGNVDEGRALLLQRLFPTAYPDDEEKEAEYQRLMRDDLVTSRVVQIDAVSEAFAGGSTTLQESEVIALMQSVNAVRVVLGTMLDVGEDDEIGTAGEEFEAERQLYGFLSWLLDWIVRSLQT